MMSGFSGAKTTGLLTPKTLDFKLATKKYDELTLKQIIAVIVEETFNIPSKNVITEYEEYIIHNGSYY